MKRSIVIAGALLLGAHGFTAPLAAQNLRGIVGLGLSFPSGVFAEDDEGGAKAGGMHGLIGAEWAPNGSRFGLRVDGAYQRFCSVLCDADFGDQDVRYQFLQGTLGGIVQIVTDPEAPVQPYVLLGAGVYNWKLQGDDVPAGFDESETDFGVNGGFGINFGFGVAAAFLEARYHNVFTGDDDIQYVPVTIGIRFGG